MKVHQGAAHVAEAACTVSWQVIELEGQAVVWLGAAGEGSEAALRLTNMSMAVPATGGGGETSATCLTGAGAAADAASALARRLSKRWGRHVVCSLDVPGGPDAMLPLLAAAERVLCERVSL